MTIHDIARLRLLNQQISAPTAAAPEDVVAHFGAMQAQDYAGALWAIGLRCPGSTEADIERAVTERRIVRTWPMRGTLHFVAADDVRWMLELMTPRVIAASRKRWTELELSEAIFAKCRKVMEKLLRGGVALTRDDLLAGLERNGISAAGGRAYHIPWRLAQERVICFGPRAGKQKTFVLLDEWIPKSRELSGEAALAELALRYFTSHGPALQSDFAWWSGLKSSDAKIAIAAASSQLASQSIDGRIYWMPSAAAGVGAGERGFLLPGFDEFLLGYTDRSAVLDPKHATKIVPGGNGMFLATLVQDGEVVGTWKRSEGKTIVVTPAPFKRLSKRCFAEALERYGEYLGRVAKFVR